MRFAKWVFSIAGIYGVLLIGPSYFLERWFGEEYPPAINHPEFFYGFMGAGLAWQFMYLLIGSDPPRYRTAMLIASAAKTSFVLAALALFWHDRVPGAMVGLVMPDAVFTALFLIAWARTPKTWPRAAGRTWDDFL